ncbi:hypothetical protein LRP88_05683 [Fusarium phalaenopsidis]
MYSSLFPFLAFVAMAPSTMARFVPRVDVPPPPNPEPIHLTTLPLPPVSPSTNIGACTSEINPRGTGCMTLSSNLDFQAGGFLPDGKHVLVFVTFTGAPLSPDPASVYNGSHILAVKTNGKKFPNGDPWKCLTCGIPDQNAIGRTMTFDYPQAFRDGKRIPFGTNILDCGKYDLNTTPDGSGNGGSIRELRLHPDGVHIGFSSFSTANGKLSQFAYFGRLQFNAKPTTGTTLTPRYDLLRVTRLFNPNSKQPVEVKGDAIFVNQDAIAVGEFRGFSGRGTEATYVGFPVKSSNIDVFAVHLQTGKVRRLTSHPEYCDPVAISPDDQWVTIEDTRGTDRQMWLSGMRNIPPITDLITTSVTSATRKLPGIMASGGISDHTCWIAMETVGNRILGGSDYRTGMWREEPTSMLPFRGAW